MKSVSVRAHGALRSARRVRGLSLIEMMIAIVMGMLLSAGIITLFASTSATNKVQDGLARLQENGRYAMTRIDADLRMLSGQYCSNFAGNSTTTSNGATMSQRAPWLYAVAGLNLPDMAAPLVYASAGPVSPRVFVQGYECSSGACKPSEPPGVPAIGTAAHKRLKGTDVLTVRYQTGTGWPVSATPAPNCGSTTVGGAITIAPATGDDDPESASPAQPKFAPGDIVLYSDCQNPSLFQVAGYGANALTLQPILGGGPGSGPFCKAASNRDARLFNFSKGFVTVTYYIGLVDSGDPDRPGVVPALIRRENGTDNELVRGVERLDFVYGVRKPDGTIAYMDADAISKSTEAAANCIAPPSGITSDAGCLWRAVRSVETHALFSTINDLPLSTVDTAFSYSAAPDLGGTPAPPTGGKSAVNDLAWGRKMRREFVTATFVRNSN